jgi:transcriptional regulator with XRE-family HTH domain
MMSERSTFAAYIAGIREDRKFTLRQMADALKVSPAYYSDVEKGRRNPLSLEKLERFAELTAMTEEERRRMYDLAGKDRSEVAPDLPEYIMQRDYVSAALRTARDLGADQKDWEAFVAGLKRRKG